MALAEQVLISLRSHVEGVSTEADGTRWGSVYLDNARIPGVSSRSFRSCLAALAKQGFYKPVDGYAFGDVLLES